MPLSESLRCLCRRVFAVSVGESSTVSVGGPSAVSVGGPSTVSVGEPSLPLSEGLPLSLSEGLPLPLSEGLRCLIGTLLQLAIMRGLLDDIEDFLGESCHASMIIPFEISDLKLFIYILLLSYEYDNAFEITDL